MTRSVLTTLALVALGSSLLTSCARQEVLERPIVSPREPVVLDCPLGVPHTQVDVAETPGGADVVFATSNQRYTDLRTRVRDQTRVHAPGQHVGVGHLGQHGLKHDHGMRLWELPPHQAQAEETPNGSVLHITLTDVAARAELLAKLQARVQVLQGRYCPG